MQSYARYRNYYVQILTWLEKNINLVENNLSVQAQEKYLTEF